MLANVGPGPPKTLQVGRASGQLRAQLPCLVLDSAKLVSGTSSGVARGAPTPACRRRPRTLPSLQAQTPYLHATPCGMAHHGRAAAPAVQTSLLEGLARRTDALQPRKSQTRRRYRGPPACCTMRRLPHCRMVLARTEHSARLPHGFRASFLPARIRKAVAHPALAAGTAPCGLDPPARAAAPAMNSFLIQGLARRAVRRLRRCLMVLAHADHGTHTSNDVDIAESACVVRAAVVPRSTRPHHRRIASEVERPGRCIARVAPPSLRRRP